MRLAGPRLWKILALALPVRASAAEEFEFADSAPRLMRAQREADRHLGAAIDMAGNVESVELGASKEGLQKRKRADQDCVWGDWVDWSVCQFTCGGGESMRTRKVKEMASGNGSSCDGNAKESRECTKNDCPVDCLWADWSKSSACSSTCGPGTKSRTRGFQQVAEFGGAQCSGNTTQVFECNLGDCPIDCEYADWDPWGGCSKSCGGGTRKRFRSVAVQPSADGNPCEDTGSEVEETPCGQNTCPVDCVLTDWGLWDLCDVSCGMGTTRRARSVQVYASYGGLACDSLSENKTCDSGICPVDCQLSDWSDWSPCDRSCETETEPGHRKRFKTVVEQGNELGKPCSSNQTSRMQTGVCSLHQCPTDCKLSDWTPWSDCSVSCGPGQAERSREVQVAASFGGRECPSGNHETKYCSVDTCPVDCQWNDWQDWRGCSTSCGPGRGIRMRDVQTPMLHGGKDCEGDYSQQRDCNLRFCPLHCALADWSDWGTCSTSCGDGQESRERHVAVEADYGGIPCTEKTLASRDCFVSHCPVHCEWSDWTDWAACTSSCGSGQQTRTRAVAVQPAYEGEVCEGFASDSRSCERLPICPTDCEWDVWTDWEACSVTCGTGVSRRTRARKKYEKDGGHVCWGTEDDEQVCSLDACPVDCALGDWSQWSACSMTCGKGSQTRLRGIRLGPANGGKACDSTLNETEICNLGICPVDCQWSVWEAWSSCSRSCNAGSYTRQRTEKVAAAHGGRACSGSADEDGVCNMQGCPVDCKMVSWSDWGSCSTSCGSGKRSQSRVVEIAPQWGGAECETNADGSVSTEKTESCNEQPCPVDCQWSSWSKFSLCSKTCEAGTMFRSRTKSPIESNGGKPCTGDAEESNFCNTQGCPRDCQWSEWTKWTQCSKVCGGGKIKRFRDIAIPRKNGGEPCIGQAEQEADCNVLDCPIACEWDEWSDWSACPVTCDGGLRTKTRKKRQSELSGGLPCVGNGTSREFCNSDPCPVDCSFGLWENWGDCSTSCGLGQRFRTRVKSAELYGGRPCEEAMIQTGECGTNEAPGCPLLLVPTTTVINAKGGSGSEWRKSRGPFNPALHGQQHEIPHPEDLLKTFNIFQDPLEIRTISTTTEATTSPEVVPCTKDEIKAALRKYDNSTVKSLDEVIEDLTGRKPARDTEMQAATATRAASLGGAAGSAVSTAPADEAMWNASQSPELTTLSEILEVLTAMPQSTAIDLLIANLTAQLHTYLNMTAEQAPLATPQQLDTYLVERARQLIDTMKARSDHPSSGDLELMRNLSAAAAAAPMTEASKDFTVPFFAKDGEEVLAEVGGDLALDVADADRFVSSALVKSAMKKAVASLASCDPSTVKVDLTIPKAILLAVWRRKAAGNVNVAYLIEVLQGSATAASIAETISKQDINTVTGQIRAQLELAGANFTLRATSLSVTILPVGDGSGEKPPGGVPVPTPDAKAETEKVSTVEVQRHNGSVQDAVVESLADGKVAVAPDAPVVVETAQQAAQATASMAAAVQEPSQEMSDDSYGESDLPKGAARALRVWSFLLVLIINVQD